MKLEFKFKGDVNAFVMAMLCGRSFTLTDGYGKTLKVEPKMVQREGMQMNIKPAARQSENSFTIPVKLPEFGGEAMMSFTYKVEDVVVAPAVSALEKLEQRPTVYGISDEADEQSWHVTEEGVQFGEKHLKDNVLVGAKEYLGHAARPAIEARPEVKVPQFKSSYGDYDVLTIKFE
ncbi:MAG: hypothetical protein ACAH17_03925 [Candidatus Paceibacterota bacterium]